MGESRRCIQPEVDVLSTLVGSQTRLCDRRTAPRGIVHVWNMCPLPVFFIYRGGSGICVRPHRYALARTLATPLAADEFGLHECDMPFLGGFSVLHLAAGVLVKCRNEVAR